MKRSQVFIIVALVVVLSTIYGLNRVFHPFEEQVRKYPVNLGDYNVTGRYTINSDTIIESLDAGETDVFLPKVVTPEVDRPIPKGSVSPWDQSAYLKIVNTLHLFVWKETLDSWKLYYMRFETDCQNNTNGFSTGDFIYFKEAWYNGSIFYSTREIVVRPVNNEVLWGGDTDFPHPILGWKGVDLKNLKIPALEALRIAEENGGETYRLNINNECSISLGLSGDYGWKIRYQRTDSLSEFEIQIDPYTGKIH